jgi:hypothetical protein
MMILVIFKSKLSYINISLDGGAYLNKLVYFVNRIAHFRNHCRKTVATDV